ncbi:MAG: hypothetical protein ACPG21_08645 [Crocinitomicaceae bacterium]
MKYLVFIGLFVAGGLVGYWVGASQSSDKEHVAEDVQVEPVTEFVYDTIVKTERVEVPVIEEEVDSNLIKNDSLTLNPELDTLKEIILSRDTTNSDDNDLNIRKDELIASRSIPIIYLNEIVDADTTVRDLLGIKENKPTEMRIQFWSSPLNYKGYKLSRNTLIVYGLSEQLTYKVYNKEGQHYLSNEGEFYKISETTAFKSFESAKREKILND